MGEETATKVLEKAAQARAELEPRHSQAQDMHESEVMKLIDKIEGRLAGDELSDEDFYEYFTEKGMVALREDRSACKTHLTVYRKGRSECDKAGDVRLDQDLEASTARAISINCTSAPKSNDNSDHDSTNNVNV